MKKLLALVLAVAMLASISGVAMAANYHETGNGALSGPHYNLNIIGVPKDKSADMTGTSGHTIFVPLKGNAKILLHNSDVDESCAKDFIVLDRNGTDGTAAFCLPAPDPDDDGTTEYTVFARALGKPGGQSFTTTCAIDDGGDTWCSSITMKLQRDTGKSKFTNVSKYLLYIYVDLTPDDDTVNLVRVPLFSDKFESYFWNYDNNGLKVAQLRFYETPTTVPEPGDVSAMTITDPVPAEGVQGATMTVTFEELQNCDFTGVTVDDVYFGQKIDVTSVNVVNSNKLEVTINIAGNAKTGDRLVYVTMPALDPDETVNATFKVVASP